MLQANVIVKLASQLSTGLDLKTALANLDYQTNAAFDNGSGANQASMTWDDTRTLTTGANETLDLNGSLTDANGASVTFTKVKVLFIRNKGTTTLSIGGAAANGFISPFGTSTDLIKVMPGGMLLLVAPDANGFACAAGTADQLKIANSAGASCDYDIVIIGA